MNQNTFLQRSALYVASESAVPDDGN